MTWWVINNQILKSAYSQVQWKFYQSASKLSLIIIITLIVICFVFPTGSLSSSIPLVCLFSLFRPSSVVLNNSIIPSRESSTVSSPNSALSIFSPPLLSTTTSTSTVTTTEDARGFEYQPLPKRERRPEELQVETLARQLVGTCSQRLHWMNVTVQRSNSSFVWLFWFSLCNPDLAVPLICLTLYTFVVVWAFIF